MALTYNGSTQRTRLSTAKIVSDKQTFSLSLWVKSINAGTTRLVAYSEDDTAPAANAGLFLALNDTVNGRARVFRRAGDGTQISLTWDGSLADGNWHLLTYVANGWADHKLFVDGDFLAKATSSTDFSSKSWGIDTRYVGVRNSAGVLGNYFEGSISDLALFSVALTGDQHVDLYNKLKWAFDVTGNAADVLSFFALSVPDDHDLTSELYNAENTGSPTITVGPAGNYLVAGGAANKISGTNLRLLKPTGAAILATGAETWREMGNIVHTPSDTGKEYKMYYSLEGASYGSDKSDVEIGLAYASTLTGTWTKYGVVIAQNATAAWEDPFVVVDGSTYHLWCENKRGGSNAYGIAYFTSTDGITWTRQDSDGSPALVAGTSGAWDDQDVSSPTVIKNGATWNMLYEGRKTAGQQGQVGLATASSAAGPWTKYVSNPVLIGAGGTWESEQLVPDDVALVGSTYWLIYHANDGTFWGCGRASSADLITWSRPTHNQMTGGDEAYTIQYTPDNTKIVALDNDDGDVYLWNMVGDAVAAGVRPRWLIPFFLGR